MSVQPSLTLSLSDESDALFLLDAFEVYLNHFRKSVLIPVDYRTKLGAFRNVDPLVDRTGFFEPEDDPFLDPADAAELAAAERRVRTWVHKVKGLLNREPLVIPHKYGQMADQPSARSPHRRRRRRQVVSRKPKVAPTRVSAP